MRKNHLQAPSGNSGAILYLDSIDAYKNEFLAYHGKVASWRKVAEPYSIHPNMARLIANGHDPGNRIRERLRLPEKQPVEICSKCGKVLTPYHQCHTNNKPRNRISIRLDNPESAARSIEKHMKPGKIDHLIRLLQDGK